MHSDPVALLALELAAVLLLAKVGGELASRLHQPPVLGELLAGVLLGNLSLFGVGALERLESDPTLDMLARVGVLLLLFEVGLESTVAQMRKVGMSALLVAVLGVVAPFGLGWLVTAWLLPAAGWPTAVFLGATLCATSVGITARVMRDLGRSQTDEARLILGAAVIDDVLGLIVLAVVGALIAAMGPGAQGGGAGGGLLLSLVVVTGKALLFLLASLVLGQRLTPRLFRRAARLHTQGVLLAVGLSFCFVLSWLADAVGLAPIVGAFAAGLVLEPAMYQRFVDRGEKPLEELLAPLSGVLVPVFFVVMGMRTDLRAFSGADTLLLAAALTVAAVAGKQACALGVLGRGVDRWAVGLGMIPRGEVGLIFANIGLQLKSGDRPLLDRGAFSAVVIMVIVTTLVTPPLLSWRLRRLPARDTATG